MNTHTSSIKNSFFWNKCNRNYMMETIPHPTGSETITVFLTTQKNLPVTFRLQAKHLIGSSLLISILHCLPAHTHTYTHTNSPHHPECFCFPPCLTPSPLCNLPLLLELRALQFKPVKCHIVAGKEEAEGLGARICAIY